MHCMRLAFHNRNCISVVYPESTVARILLSPVFMPRTMCSSSTMMVDSSPSVFSSIMELISMLAFSMVHTMAPAT